MQKLPDRSAERKDLPFAVYRALFCLLPFAGGLYFTWQWCLAAVVQGAVLVWQVRYSGRLRRPGGLATACCGGLILCGACWNLAFGIDPAAAGDGLLRLLALGGFGLLLMQWDAARRQQLVQLLPFVGAAMVLVTLLAGLHPGWRPFLYENSRMAGPFQYANTFAAFLLAGLAVERPKTVSPPRMVADALLLWGVVASGSRSALLLLGLLLLVVLLRQRPHPAFWAVAGAAALTVGLYAALHGGWVFARFVRPGALSTVWGRLLYCKDGLRLLAGHPLGVGYLGWFYLQRMIQTGVYNVRFVHNDLLQFALDFGLPAALAAVAWIIHRLRHAPCAPAAAVLLCLHCLADPDFSFQWMGFVLVLALSPRADPAPGRTGSGRVAALAAAAAVLVLFVPRGAADAAFRLGNLPLACTLAPWDTELATEQMLAEPTLSAAAADATALLERNPYQAIAWQILAEEAMSRGAYDTMATAQRQAVVLLAYDQTLYEEAMGRLQYALRSGWDAARAAEEMSWLLERMDTTLANTDPLAWKLKDQPQLAFPERVRLMVHMLEQTT